MNGEVAPGFGRPIGVQSGNLLYMHTHLGAFLVPGNIASVFLPAPCSLYSSQRTFLRFGMEKGKDISKLFLAPN